MRLKIFYVLISGLILSACASKDMQSKQSASVSVLPHPLHINLSNNFVELNKSISIIATSEDEKNVAGLLGDFLTLKNIPFTVSTDTSANMSVKFITVNDSTVGNEGYKVAINTNGAQIQGATGAGLFYGMQTLIQLISEYGTQLPIGEINDSPCFPYRGLHLDVGRHMFPVAFIKKYIDIMSHFKFNTFHWHLTEDQGWRIEIKKYPRLQEIAAFRKETLIGHASSSKQYDGKRYGGFYTQDEIREIVAYATQRYVTVIPEIELPGHSQAALTAYPQLGCTGGPYEVATTWGVFEEVYCAGKETTFEFLEDVLDEVMDLFPSTYIHIGGDESPKTRWGKCPHCQQRIKAEKLKDEHELQSYFIQRVEKYLNSKGRNIIGWDEILEGGLAPNATVMSWRGEEGGVAAAQQKHTVIMTPGNWCYLDHYQANPESEPLAIGGLTTVQKVYEYEPLPPQLSAQEKKYILGAQCNVWTEYMKTSDHVEYMVYPRAIAMAEVLWSAEQNKSYNDFVSRLKKQKSLLDLWNINYAPHIFTEIKTDSIK